MAVYLDYAATAPMRAEALETLVQYLGHLGNPSSVHGPGQVARKALEEAREQLARAIGANRNEIIFTSGGTESDNLAIKGLYWERNKSAKRPVILSAMTEHHAVIDTIEWLEKAQGAVFAVIPVDDRGVVDLHWLKEYLSVHASEVALITLMWANNETGVVTPIEEVTALAAAYEIPVHSDAVATLGHMPINFSSSGLTAMSIAAHKIGGPIGVGALVVARSAKLTSLVHGGGQERAMRSGTMNFAGAKAFAKAAELAVSELDEFTSHTSRLTARVRDEVCAAIPTARFSRGDAPALPQTAHFTFPGCSGDSLLFLLDRAGVAVSNGSACQAGVTAASHVLLAMGRDESEAAGCLRVSIGLETTDADIDALLAALPEAHAAAARAGLTF